MRRTIEKVRQTIYDIRYGVRNVVRWAHVIWGDRDWDWAYLAKIMERKLDFMGDAFIDHGSHVLAERDGRRMKLCAKLLRRLQDDNYLGDPPYTRDQILRAQKQAEREQALVGKLIGQHMRAWWD